MNSSTLSINEVVTTFENAILEVERAELRQFVVAMVSDASPMRTTGSEIRITGKSIYSTAFSADAKHVAKTINEQFKAMDSETRVRVEKSADWRVRRIEQLRKLIEGMKRAAPDGQGTIVHLTDNELKALRIAFKSARANGHDFGFVGDIVKGMRPMKAQAVGAIVTSLQQKGLIEVHEPVVTNEGGKHNTFVQFTWVPAVAEIEKLVKEIA